MSTIKKAVTPTPVVAKANPDWDNFVGTYRDPWGDTEIAIMNGELVMFDPTESLMKLVPAGKNKFKIVAEAFWSGAIGEYVTFEVGADGKAFGMKVVENYTPHMR